MTRVCRFYSPFEAVADFVPAAATGRILCNYAYRMVNTRSHGSLEALFAAAGVTIDEKPQAKLAEIDAELEGMSCPLYP